MKTIRFNNFPGYFLCTLLLTLILVSIACTKSQEQKQDNPQTSSGEIQKNEASSLVLNEPQEPEEEDIDSITSEESEESDIQLSQKIFPARNPHAIPNLRTVEDYYQLMPDELFHRYDLHVSKQDVDDEEAEDVFHTATVDNQNGYIRIFDEGTGGWSFHEEFVLFRKPDHTAIIGINAYDKSVSIAPIILSFYQYNDGEWIDVTEIVLPDIDSSVFLDEAYETTYKKEIEERFNIPDFQIDPHLEIGYVLPQHGTTIQVILNLPQFREPLDFIMNVANSIEQEYGIHIGEQHESELEELLLGKAIKYKEIHLNWNKNQGIFEIGEKLLYENGKHEE